MPLVLIFLGSCLSKVYSYQKFKNYIIYYGTVSTILFVFILIYNHGIFYIFRVVDARNEFYFSSSIICILAIAFLINSNRLKQLIPVMLINIYGIFISGSRTNLIIALIFMTVLYFNLKVKHFLFFTIAISGLLFVFNSTPIFSQTMKELTFDESNTVEDIGTKYRGFESYRAAEKIINGNTINKFMGFGLFESIDLGVYVDLGGYTMSSIPILHNGYLYLIIRLGILGLIFYIIFFVKYYNYIKIYFLDKERKILLGTIVALLVSNIVVGSFFNMEYSFLWIVIGFSLYRFQIIK